MTEAKAQMPVTLEAALRLDCHADALDILIRFHDREIDQALIESLHTHDIPADLPDLFFSEAAQVAAQGLRDELNALGRAPDEQRINALAAEYADIFLTHSYRASPNGSVWLTEDHLERQMPMFEVREWYEHYGISVPNWRIRADDHIVHELQFLVHLLRAATESTLLDAGRFLDVHVLPWIPEFAKKSAAYTTEPLYAALMALTSAALEELRCDLEEITGKERVVRLLEPPQAERQPEEPQAYVPGISESW
jgi:TorA maturation chaperone TorD